MRAFIAIDLPEELKEEIFALAQKIAKQVDIRLVEKENLHLTMVFLGEVSEKEKEKVLGILGVLRGFGEIKLRLGETEIFPDRKKPCGIWINLGGEREKLFSLYKRIVDGLLSAGIKLEENKLKFSPHITIGRMRKKVGGIGSAGWRVGETCLPAGRVGGEFMVKKITFFESKTSLKGPKYTKLGEFEVK